MGQDPITNPLFDPGGKNANGESNDGNVNESRTRRRAQRRTSRGKARRKPNENPNEQKDKKSKPMPDRLSPNANPIDDVEQLEYNPIHKLLGKKMDQPRPSLGVKVDRRPPRLVDRQTVIDSELKRIRAMEALHLKTSLPKTPGRKVRKAEKATRQKACGSDSNRNLTKDEEFILEHVTAFVFRRKRTAAPPLPSDAERMMTDPPTNNEISRWESVLQHEHIKRVSPYHVPNCSVEYHCTICLVHIENVYQALHHYKEKSHKSIRKQLNELDSLLHLRRKFEINPDRIAVLNAEINDTLKRIKNVDLNVRQEVFGRVRTALVNAIPNCDAELYGSSLTQTCLPDSDVNVVIFLADSRPNKLLSRALALFNQMEGGGDKFHAVSEHFYSSSNNSSAFTPNVKLIDDATGMKITIIAADSSNTPRIKTANLIKFYLEFEPKMNDLALLFRQWGNWCALDVPEDGSIPAYAFTLCVIYFFQQQKWCPVLHNLTECRSDRLPVLKRNDKWYYHPRKSALDEESIEIEIDITEAIAEEAESIEPPSEEPITVDGETSDMDDINEVDTDQTIELRSTVPDDLSLADILIQFFEFFAFQFEMEDKVVSLRYPTIISRGDKGWGSRRIAIEDPYQVKRNICRTLNSQMIFEYFRTRLRATLMRFRIGPNELRQIIHANEEYLTNTNQGEVNADQVTLKKAVSESDDTDAGLQAVFVEDVKDRREEEQTRRILTKAQNEMKKLQIAERRAPKLQLNSKLLDSINSYLTSDEKKKKANEKAAKEAHISSAEEDEEGVVEEEEEESASNTSTESTPSDTKSEDESKEAEETTAQSEWLVRLAQRKEQVIKQLQIVFDGINISGGLMPMKVCQLCKQEGHYAVDCPDDPNKHALVLLPELSDAHYAMLDNVLEKVYSIHCPSPSEIDHREKALEHLQNFMITHFDSNCELKLFGSSRNGFGFRGSDMDLCLTFKHHEEDPPPMFSNAVQVIKQLSDVLKKNDLFKNVVPITAAKVPIVKFEYLFCGTLYEGDISYYNVLAQRNTQLLSLYATLDSRCQKLGYVLKAMVKECGVGDASRGSLSSYAYVLLLIHYLQQINVLPVLQELYEEEDQPVHTVEGFNTWFQDNREVISRLRGEVNDQSLSRIWIGFLQYYTENFKFDKTTIQIRHKCHLTTFEKEWTSKCISIEDPFELTHNLGCGVSRKMANYIVKVLQRARGIFGRFNYQMFAENHWEFNLGLFAESLFSSHLLTDGDEVPNDRCCRICGKIGHFVKDCPLSRRNKNKTQNQNGTNDNMPAQKCYACNESGHFAKKCPNRRNGRKNRVYDEHEQQSPMRGPRQKFDPDHYRRSPRNRNDRRVYHDSNMGQYRVVQNPMMPPPVSSQHHDASTVIDKDRGGGGRKYFYNPGNAPSGNRTRLNSDTRKEYQTRPTMRPRTKTD